MFDGLCVVIYIYIFFVVVQCLYTLCYWHFRVTFG